MACKHAKKKNSDGEWTLCSGVTVKIVREKPKAKPKAKPAPASKPALPMESMATKRVNDAATRIERRYNLRQAQGLGRRIRGN